MKLKTLFITCTCCILYSATFAQNKILTTDGKTLNAASVEINKTNITANVNGDNQTISKSDILAVVPDGKKGFTFRAKNGKKMPIKNKFIHFDFSGTDRPRIYAYKYLGTNAKVNQLYVLNSDGSMTEEQFASIYHAQQKRLKTNNVVSITSAAVILLVGYASMTYSKKNLNDAQNALNSL